MDLWDELAGGGSARRLAALAAALPPDSACGRARLGADGWSYQEVVRAGIYNTLRDLAWALSAPKGEPRPQPIGPRSLLGRGTGPRYTPDQLLRELGRRRYATREEAGRA